MSGPSGYASRAFVDWARGRTAMPVVSAAYIALFTAAGLDDGTGFTEVATGAYARAAAAGTWAAAAGSSPASGSNAATIAFPKATADWGTIVAWGIYDAATAGNLLFWDYLGAVPPIPFTVTLGSPGVFTAPAHGFANGDQVVISADNGGTLPMVASPWSGLQTVADATADTFDIGAATSSSGSGQVHKVAPIFIANTATAAFLANALTIYQG